MTGRSQSVTKVLANASRGALQWRLLLLWLLAQALPVALACMPLWAALIPKLDYSLSGKRLLAGQNEASTYLQILQWLGGQHELAAVSGGGLVLALELPWLAGMIMTAAASEARLPLRSLIAGGLDYYWRMVRLGLWSLCVLGLFASAGGALAHLANERAHTLLLESEVQRWRYLALGLMLLLCWLGQACADAARARLAAEPQRRSAVLAFFRSSVWLARRPGALWIYLLLTAAGLLGAAVLAWLRTQWPANGFLGVLRAFALGQALVLSLGFMRAARSFALVAALRVGKPEAQHVEASEPEASAAPAQTEPDGLA